MDLESITSTIDKDDYDNFFKNESVKDYINIFKEENPRFRDLPTSISNLAFYLLINDKLGAIEGLNTLFYYRSIPTIEEFLTSEYLGDHPIVNKENIWRNELIDLFNPKNSYIETVFTGSIGCFTEDTKILLSDNSTISFGELVKKDTQTIEVKDYDIKNNQFTNSIAINPRITREVDELIEIEFEDNYKVKCTLDHKFLTKNRGWVEAQYLTEEDDLVNYKESL